MRRALVARFNEAHLCRGSMVHISVGGPSGCFCGTAVVYAVQRSLSGTLPLTLMYRFFAGGDMRASTDVVTSERGSSGKGKGFAANL